MTTATLSRSRKVPTSRQFDIREYVFEAIANTKIENLKKDNLFVVYLPQAKGCYGHGKTEAEALTDFREVFLDWALFRLEQGLSIPLF